MTTAQRIRSGSGAIGGATQPRASEQEWRAARATDEAEHAFVARSSPAAWVGLVTAALVAGVLPGIYPLSPGYGAGNTGAVAGAAVVAALAAAAVVALTWAEFRSRSRASLLYGAALLSAEAAAIHFAVAKTHFEEYALFGVFFLVAGIAQLGWALLVLVRPLRSVLWLGVLGNLAIAALWAVDRIWGLPLGPEHWNPEPIGFGDAATTGFELLLALACLKLLRGRRAITTSRQKEVRRLLLLAVPVVVVTALALLSTMAIGSPVITPST
jgi:hypothetical protein